MRLRQLHPYGIGVWPGNEKSLIGRRRERANVLLEWSCSYAWMERGLNLPLRSVVAVVMVGVLGGVKSSRRPSTDQYR